MDWLVQKLQLTLAAGHLEITTLSSRIVVLGGSYFSTLTSKITRAIGNS